jgi:hypothetical protein
VAHGYVLCAYRQANSYPSLVSCTPGPSSENLPWKAFEIAGDRARHARTVALYHRDVAGLRRPEKR